MNVQFILEERKEVYIKIWLIFFIFYMEILWWLFLWKGDV